MIEEVKLYEANPAEWGRRTLEFNPVKTQTQTKTQTWLEWGLESLGLNEEPVNLITSRKIRTTTTIRKSH
eukprot:Pgem_evm1s14943